MFSKVEGKENKHIIQYIDSNQVTILGKEFKFNPKNQYIKYNI